MMSYRLRLVVVYKTLNLENIRYSVRNYRYGCACFQLVGRRRGRRKDRARTQATKPHIRRTTPDCFGAFREPLNQQFQQFTASDVTALCWDRNVYIIMITSGQRILMKGRIAVLSPLVAANGFVRL